MSDRVRRREFLARAAALASAATLGTLAGATSRGSPIVATAQAGRGRWVSRASLPFARTEISVTHLNGKVYVLGGYAHGRVDQPFNQEYDPATDTWRDLAPMPRGLNHMGIIGFNGKIYVFGGFIEQNRNAIRDVSEYDVALNRWRELTPLPTKRGAMSVVELNGKLHLIGGRDDFSVRAHEVYDPATNSWSARTPLPTGAGRDHMGVAVMGGKIHAVGGRFDTFFYNTDLHHAYDPVTNDWRPRALLPTARSGVAAAVLGGRMFIFGGESGGGVFSENEAYDPANDSWTTMAPMPTPRHGTGAGVVGNTIYIPAGGLVTGGSRLSTTHEAFTPP